MRTFEPAIKWSGSKRSQAHDIVSYFPKEIDTYYELFCGGCSVLRVLIDSDVKVKKYVCSDINSTLINLWLMIKEHPARVCEEYEKHWKILTSFSNEADKKSYFEKVRDIFNKKQDPLDFMFLDRVCFNGLIRYNKQGNFNTPFHLNRNGINPISFEKIINEWSNILKENNVEFKLLSYEQHTPSKNDFLYLDPPYANTKGMYFGGFDTESFFNWLRNISCPWILSFDGKNDEIDYTCDIPTDLFDKHIYISSGKSSFKKLNGINKNSHVFESLYIKNCPVV